MKTVPNPPMAIALCLNTRTGGYAPAVFEEIK
jgi:hypothetical protein